MIVVDIAFALLAAMIWLNSTRRVTLYRDAIAVTSWSGTRVLRSDEISCRRMGRAGKYQDDFYYVHVPADNEQREMKLPLWLHMDKIFFSWMNAIPRVT